MLLRKWVPVPLRIAVARTRRSIGDRRTGVCASMAVTREPGGSVVTLPQVIRVIQPIRQTAFFEGKLANIRLGASRLDGIVLLPGEIFSFWHLVGPPLASAGFATGRAIRADVLQGETGGGLCQVSGLAYELGLRAGLEVLERHPHSRDLYTEEERFTPLGLDATVVWPWKDLRLRNGHGVPVCLHFVAGEDLIEGRVHAEGLAAQELAIMRTDFQDRREVQVSRVEKDGNQQLVSRDSYVIDRH